jgi:hypothetical protein
MYCYGEQMIDSRVGVWVYETTSGKGTPGKEEYHHGRLRVAQMVMCAIRHVLKVPLTHILDISSS